MTTHSPAASSRSCSRRIAIRYADACPPALASRLYAVAERLERAWVGADLSDDFGSRMIAAVLRFLDRAGERRADGTFRADAEQAAFAEALLHRFWTLNARRDARRRHEALYAMAFVSLETVGEARGTAALYDPLRHDIFAGEAGRSVARFLEAEGWPRERAWAFVLRESGREWDEVRFLLAERFEVDASEARLRKWGQRFFAPVRPRVRAFLESQAEPNPEGRERAAAGVSRGEQKAACRY